MTFVEMQVKWSVTLTDRLGPKILTVLEIKEQVLHRVHLHVKVPGWLLNLNALLIWLVCQEFWRHPKRQIKRCDVNATSTTKPTNHVEF